MMKPPPRHRSEFLWRPKVVLRKWLNMSAKGADFRADSSDDNDNDDNEDGDSFIDHPVSEALPRLRRRNSETFRAQYINKKEIRVCVGTWNVGGITPPDELNIDEWLESSKPADVYVLGLQEVVPLNAGNIFGAEDGRQVLKWEGIIREALSRITPEKDYKCFSDPPSPTKFKPMDDSIDMKDEIDSDCEDKVDPIEIFHNSNERIRLNWLEPPSNLLAHHVLERTCSSDLRSTKSLTSTDPNKKFSSMKFVINEDYRALSDIPKLDLEKLIYRRMRRRTEYVRIVSKQMVGIFLTIWVRRRLRKHIDSVHVSTVGVGAMGYIGNKGSVSISMLIHQTLFCFICTHLTSGEKEGDELKRNEDVHEIHRKTQFYPSDGLGFPRHIHDHERIIWLGDLNYRINFPYEGTLELISNKEWSKLIDKDQLNQELRDGCVFEGWYEGRLDFPPTYKYEPNSQKYYGEDPKAPGRRNPAWCDRVLSYGNGIELVNYKRAELMFSDHRPVTATYLVEVEDLSHRKLQRALTITDAEIESLEMIVVDKQKNIKLGQVRPKHE